MRIPKKEIKKIEYLTDTNNHCQARINIAKLFNMRKEEEIFKHILEIQMLEGHLSHYLVSYRSEITDLMLVYIKAKCGRETYELINNLL